jgi:hypothetical protein
MKRLLFFVICLFNLSIVFSQDVIITTSGDKIKAKVSEIGIDQIKYKKFENQEGPVISILKTDVFMINYENGTKDIFNSSAKLPVITQPSEGKEMNLTALLEAEKISELTIEGGDSTFSITITKNDQKLPLDVLIPAGVTKLGFIEMGQIHSAGISYTFTFSSEKRSLKMFTNVETNNLESDGFSIVSQASEHVIIPSDKLSQTVIIKGQLKVAVPNGYSGFILSGYSGTINSGRIVVTKSRKADKKKYLYGISFGDMELSTK